VIRQRDFLARHRHRIALVAVLGALSFAIAAEHSGLGHGGAAHDGMGEAISLCLAIVGGGIALGLGAAALASFTRRRGSIPRELGSGSVALPMAPATMPPRSRAGPSLLQVFRR
jgi:hypothetical protein